MTTDARKRVIDTPVCHKPLIVSEVEADGVHLVARPGLRFPVEEIAEGQLMVSEPRLRLHVLASDRRSLQKSLEETIARTWTERINCPLPSVQSSDWRVRAVLLALFKPY